ncbi:MAG: phosphoribosyltransferase [Thermomicrobiales bacterium]|nr:phosphoribosyltransferase [Thermomicrobiales bacterium]
MGRFGVHPYPNRAVAGRQLAASLTAYRGPKTLVLGIPRGGVPVAAEVARVLDADLDIVVARKLGAPFQEELAIGAVTANGGRFLNQELIDEIAVSQDYLTKVIERESAEARRRETRFRGDRPAAPIEGRTVIVVDDGLATGATMRAAVHSVRLHQPARLVVAVPVGSKEACATLSWEADEVVCLQTPEPFWAVGYYYEEFDPVEDDEVATLLRDVWAASPDMLNVAGAANTDGGAP